MGFVPAKIPIRSTNTRSDGTRSKWKNRQESGSTTNSQLKFEPTIEPLKRRIKFLLKLILLLFGGKAIWELIKLIKIF